MVNPIQQNGTTDTTKSIGSAQSLLSNKASNTDAQKKLDSLTETLNSVRIPENNEEAEEAERAEAAKKAKAKKEAAEAEEEEEAERAEAAKKAKAKKEAAEAEAAKNNIAVKTK